MNAAAWLQGLPQSDRWRSALFARAPQIATWILALAIAVQAAIIVTDLAGAGAEPDVDPAATPAPAAPPRLNAAAIANSHLFGEAPADTATAADAPQTNMPLVLTGIIAADDPETGLAIVGETAVAARVRAVGDTLPGGVRLHAVYGDRVLLDRGGRIEALVLPRQYTSSSPAGAAPRPPPPIAAAPADNPAVERMRQLISEDPGVISDIMRQQPVFAQGRQRGYRVYPGRNRQAFMRLGLRPGDLVTAINGTPLDDPARGAEIFKTIGSSSEARVTVMRNGRSQELTLNMAQIATEAEQIIDAPGQPVSADPAPVMPNSVTPNPD
jgi:general secretion pathway protein C